MTLVNFIDRHLLPALGVIMLSAGASTLSHADHTPNSVCWADGGPALCAAGEPGLYGYDPGPIGYGADGCANGLPSAMPAWGFASEAAAVAHLETAMETCMTTCGVTSLGPASGWYNPGWPGYNLVFGLEYRARRDYRYEMLLDRHGDPACNDLHPPVEGTWIVERLRPIAGPPGYRTHDHLSDPGAYCYRPLGDFCPVPGSNPITPARGCKTLTATDYSTAGGLRLTRYYNNPSNYSYFGPNSNTFAGTVSRRCNLKWPTLPPLSTPGQGGDPAPPYPGVPQVPASQATTLLCPAPPPRPGWNDR